MEKQIFVLNGSGGVGKDTFADLVGTLVPTSHVSAITPAVQMAQIIGYDGTKTERNRKLLSDLKAIMVEYNDYPTTYLAEQVRRFLDDPETQILFMDIREPEEIDKAVKAFGAKTVLLKNKNVKPITSNRSDGSVFDYQYDYCFANDETIEDLQRVAEEFCRLIGVL